MVRNRNRIRPRGQTPRHRRQTPQTTHPSHPATKSNKLRRLPSSRLRRSHVREQHCFALSPEGAPQLATLSAIHSETSSKMEKGRAPSPPLHPACELRRALERKSRAELHLTSIGRRARIRVELRAAELILISGKVWVIQNVERLPPKFKRLMLCDKNPLAHRRVEVGQSVQRQMIPPARTNLLEQRLAHRKRRRHNIAREERHRMQLRRIAIQRIVHGRCSVVCPVEQQIRNAADRGCEHGRRESRLCCEDAALAPSAEEILPPAGGMIPER